ncbi:MAG: replication-associated recombination protein A [Clostridia bacterium]|nr:replication-associated recombination protein A [Clostridia bacterium]
MYKAPPKGNSTEEQRGEPLAYRMSPRTLEEFAGQKHILAEGKLLYRMIKADRLSSVIFWGPPGTGKTSLARLIAATTKTEFRRINAVSSGIAEIKQIVAETQDLLMNPSGRTVLFIDEIHRFNKAQQDALLPYVEDGTIILIGATTENPFFEVNKALISRSTVFQLLPLTRDDILSILQMALSDKERGLGNYDIECDADALEFLADVSSGDARTALNALELAFLTTSDDLGSRIHITREIAAECVQQKSIRFDKKGDSHYDNISALIKSMRGSDPDAAAFYLARAIAGGEDINFIARRIVICASEDVGTANPTALLVAQAAAEAIRMIGMPEARILLAHAAITVAASPKSNAAYMAIDSALADVQSRDTGEVPPWLRNPVTDGLKEFEYGQGYKYAHDYPGHVADLEFLPPEMKGTKYYRPCGNGAEQKIIEYLNWAEKLKEEQRGK